MLLWLMNMGFAGGGAASASLMAQERSAFRRVFGRLFSRVN